MLFMLFLNVAPHTGQLASAFGTRPPTFRRCAGSTLLADAVDGALCVLCAMLDDAGAAAAGNAVDAFCTTASSSSSSPIIAMGALAPPALSASMDLRAALANAAPSVPAPALPLGCGGGALRLFWPPFGGAEAVEVVVAGAGVPAGALVKNDSMVCLGRSSFSHALAFKEATSSCVHSTRHPQTPRLIR